MILNIDFQKLIENRESIRNYDPEKLVPEETLKRILNAGRLAPSAANYQPWQFLLISSKKMLEKVSQSYQRKWLSDAPHILVVKGFIELAWVRNSDNYNSLETDLTIAMDHMILAAESEGVSTCWIAAFIPEVLSNALELNSNEQVFAITPLGYPKEGYKKKGQKDRKPFDDVVKFI